MPQVPDALQKKRGEAIVRPGIMTEAGASRSTPRVLRVAVVGGGITGLALAYRLRTRLAATCVEVTLLEASDTPGGKVFTFHEEGYTLEGGPDSFLTRKPQTLALVQELGLADDLVETPPAHRRSFLYVDGRLVHPPKGLVMGVPTDLESLFASPVVSRAGKVRALQDLVLPRLLREGEDTSIGEFLTRRLGREIVTRLAEPILSGVYAGSADELSLDATAPQLREAERRRRSLIQGLKPPTTGRAAAQVQGGTAPAPPALFATLGSGLDRLVAALVTALGDAGVAVRTGAQGRVTALARGVRPDGTPLYQLRTQAGEPVEADAVVLTVPAPDAAVLLQDVAPEASAELGAVRYVDVALVGLGYRNEDVDLPPGSGFVVPRDQDLPITATTWLSQKWPGTAPPGHTLLRVYLGRSGEAPVLTHSDEGLVELARDSVRRTVGERGAPTYVRVVRVPRGLPQYTVGHLTRLANTEHALAAVPGLWVTGAAFRGVGLPDCIRQAEETADQVAAFAAGRPASVAPATSG